MGRYKLLLFIFLLDVSCHIFNIPENNVETVWEQRYNGPANASDQAFAMALDNLGNIYVTGQSNGDYATIKYNENGGTMWVKIYNGPGNGSDKAVAIAVDANCNIYVTGQSESSGTGIDYATIKYNSDGQEQWVQRYNGPEDSNDEANAIVLDGQSNVYVTGGSSGDYATIKYNSAGQEQWVQRYNGPSNGKDKATAIAIDAQGNVYVTGSCIGLGISNDYATIKYNSAGVQQWVKRYNGPGNGSDIATAIAVDDQDNIYVTGSSANSSANLDFATIKYNSAGVQQWLQRYDGTEKDDGAKALVIDGQGSVYVTGYSCDSSGFWFAGFWFPTRIKNHTTIKYNSAGQEQWMQRYDGTESDDGAKALVIDGQGSVYVTGSSATVKYNSLGVQKWIQKDYNNETYAIAVDDLGNVYVTGYSTGLNSDYVTIKYRQIDNE
jgi:uncharacterized delta-60 repeat protein